MCADHSSVSSLAVLNAIKKKDDNNLIDLTLFKESVESGYCDNNDSLEWNVTVHHENATELKDHKNLTKRFSNECEGRRVRHSVLEAFDPLLEINSGSSVIDKSVSQGIAS